MNLNESLKAPRAVFEFECRDADGNLKWQEESTNLVTDNGIIWLLNITFAGTGTTPWYLGLLDGTPAVSDTPSSHSGWTEVGYSGARQKVSFPQISSGQSISTTGTITFNSVATFNGAFLVSVDSFDGTSGFFYNATNFSATRTVASGDTLNYTITLSVS